MKTQHKIQCRFSFFHAPNYKVSKVVMIAKSVMMKMKMKIEKRTWMLRIKQKISSMLTSVLHTLDFLPVLLEVEQ